MNKRSTYNAEERLFPSDSVARHALREIIDNADLLDVTGPEGERWLLVCAPPSLLELLAEFEAEREDDDNGADAELEEHVWSSWAPDWHPHLFIPSEVYPKTRKTKR